MKKNWDYLNCEKMVNDSTFVEGLRKIANRYNYDLKCHKKNPCRFELDPIGLYHPDIYVNHSIINGVIVFVGLSISFDGYGACEEFIEDQIIEGLEMANKCKKEFYEFIDKHKNKFIIN